MLNTRHTPANIAARKDYILRAMIWELIFIDETTLSKGLHRKRGTSKKGTPVTYTALNNGKVANTSAEL